MIHSDDYNEKVSRKEEENEENWNLNLYLKNKWIARNVKHKKFLFFRLRKFLPEKKLKKFLSLGL